MANWWQGAGGPLLRALVVLGAVSVSWTWLPSQMLGQDGPGDTRAGGDQVLAGQGIWTEQAYTLYRTGNYSECIRLAQENDSEEDAISELFLFFCNVRKSLQERDHDATRWWRTNYGSLLNEVGIIEIDLLAEFKQDDDKDVRIYAERILKQAYTRISGIGDVALLRRYAESDDPDIRARAVAGIAKVLAVRRSVVLDGGTLSVADQSLMTDESLIRLLISQLGDDTYGRSQRFLDSEQLAELDRGDANACLILIETPAVPYVRIAVKDGSTAAELTLKQLGAAIDRRLQKFPHSTWCSSTGTKPVVGFLGSFCNRCKIQLRMESQFCTQCGEVVEAEVSGDCRKCRKNLPEGAKFCDQCGTSVEAQASSGGVVRTCSNPRCAQSLAADTNFCPKCGRRAASSGP